MWKKEWFQHQCDHWREYDVTGMSALDLRKARGEYEQRRCPDCSRRVPTPFVPNLVARPPQ